MKLKTALLLDETQKVRLDWRKHKIIDLIGGNIYKAILLELLNWTKQKRDDLIEGNSRGAI